MLFFLGELDELGARCIKSRRRAAFIHFEESLLRLPTLADIHNSTLSSNSRCCLCQMRESSHSLLPRLEKDSRAFSLLQNGGSFLHRFVAKSKTFAAEVGRRLGAIIAETAPRSPHSTTRSAPESLQWRTCPGPVALLCDAPKWFLVGL